MPKATPSKAELPKKPPKVREVKDAALMAQRVAEYDRLMAIYLDEMEAYEEGQKERDQKKKAAKRGAGKATEAEESGERTPKRSNKSASPSPKQPKPSPSPKQPSSRNATQPTVRQLAAAVTHGRVWPDSRARDAFGVPIRQAPGFCLQDPARMEKQMAWAEDIARFAEQAGVLTATPLYAHGAWCAHRGKPAAC